MMPRRAVAIANEKIGSRSFLQHESEIRDVKFFPFPEFVVSVDRDRNLVAARIADVVETGVLDNQLIMPRFVLNELQNIADSSDKLRRARGRRGLDMLRSACSSPSAAAGER